MSEYDESEEFSDEESSINKTYEKSMIELEETIIKNRLRNLNPKEYVNSIYQDKEISEKSKKSDLSLIDNFINLTKAKDNKSNLDYFIDLAQKKNRKSFLI